MLGLPYTIQEIAQAAGARDLFQGQYAPAPLHEAAYDTRLITQGAATLFIALKTSSRDGHSFIPRALEQGVVNFLCSSPVQAPGVNYALCGDPLDALQQWAAFHRSRFRIPVAGITGSNGKTIVKEWLSVLLGLQHHIAKSPMSYNSQLGVPLSVLRLHPRATLGLFEAGISTAGEMETLAQIIQPGLGILTHMGAAHAEGFASEAQKLDEKLLLFRSAHTVFAGSWQPAVAERLRREPFALKTAGPHAGDHLFLRSSRLTGAGRELEAVYQDRAYRMLLPLSGEADLENAMLALLAALELGLPPEAAAERLLLLEPVHMRMEMISDPAGITLLNDSYTADPDSVRNAFQALRRMGVHPRKRIILSDLAHQGARQAELQAQLFREAEALTGPGGVRTVGPVYAALGYPHSYPDTDALLRSIRYEDYADSTVLIKGARAFGLERVIPLLSRKPNATQFRISLTALEANYRKLRAAVPPGVRAMCMVKASSYGSGTWEIAQALEAAGADYLAVAYTSEGIELRQAGIRLPMLVMNPDPDSLGALLRARIEPEISSLELLRRYVREARLAGADGCPIHLKLETGMGRLGLTGADLEPVLALLAASPEVSVASVMTHLAAADDPAEDEFTRTQLERFQALYGVLEAGLGFRPLRHALNTAGILRFPEYAMDMVRMGIGLYGIEPSPGRQLGLAEIGGLYTHITQIQTHPPGTSVGYGRSQRTQRESRIATVPVGYADGVPRSLGNGRIPMLVRGRLAPTFGRICMDMLMLDVTDIPEAAPGDEVAVFGVQGGAFQSVCALAEAAGTIPYEILVRISPRVRRVYVRE